jgi:hypothetical protein
VNSIEAKCYDEVKFCREQWHERVDESRNPTLIVLFHFIIGCGPLVAVRAAFSVRQRATLNAILKYPWGSGDNPAKQDKWGVYETERSLFNWVHEGHSLDPFAKSPEAAIMDWADDITYAVHDLVDFYCAGQIPVDRLADDNDPAERDIFFAEVFARRLDLAPRRADLEQTFKEVLEFFPLDRRYIGTLEQRTGLSQFSTVLISRFVNAITLVPPTVGVLSRSNGMRKRKSACSKN